MSIYDDRLAIGGLLADEECGNDNVVHIYEHAQVEYSDLVPELSVGDDDLKFGRPISVDYSVKNIGDAPTNGAASIVFRLTAPDGTSTTLGAKSIASGIAAGDSRDGVFETSLPADLPTGDYTISATIDTSFAEITTDNNSNSARVTIFGTDIPDYRLTSVGNIQLSLSDARQAAEGSLDASFAVSNSNGSPFEIAAYWSADDVFNEFGDAKAGAITVESVSQEGTAKISIDQGSLLTNAKYLFLVANPGGAGESIYYDDENILRLGLPPGFQSISSQYDDQNPGNSCDAASTCSFGPFISKVPLTTEFAVKLETQAVGQISSVSAALVGLPGVTVQASGENSDWKFTFKDMTLTTDTKVLVTARTDLGIERTFEFELNVIDLDFELLVGMPTSVGLGAANLTTEEVRLIAGFDVSYPVEASLTSGGKALDVIPFQDEPNEADGDPYEIALKLNALTEQTLVDFSEPKGSASVNDAQLSPDNTVFAIVVGGTVLKSTKLHVIDVPGWVGEPTAKRFNYDTEAYEVDFGYGFNVGTDFFNAGELPNDLPIPEGALNVEDNRVTARLDMLLNAPVRLTQEAKASAKKFELEAKLLGRDLFEKQTIPIDQDPNFKIELPGLDQKTLSAGTLRLSVGNVLPDDFSWQIFGGLGLNGNLSNDSLKFIQNVTKAGTLNTGIFYVRPTIKPTLESKLSLGFGLEVGLNDGKLNSKNSYLDFDGYAESGIEAGIEAGLGFSFGPITLSLASLEASINASLRGGLKSRIQFGGTVTQPTIDAAGSTARLGITSQLDLKLNGKGVGYESGSKPFPINSTPVANIFDRASSVDLEDDIPTDAFENASFQSKLGDIEPVDGDSYLLLGDPSGNIPNGESTEPFSSRVRLQSRMPGTTESIGYHLNVLSNSSSLTPETHFLETVLKGSEVLVSRIDLAELPQIESSNPLGFASGWTPLSGSPDETVEFYKLYNLEFRLITDSSANEKVAVALDGLQIVEGQPKTMVTADSLSSQEGVIVPVELLNESLVATVQLQNTGRANGVIRRIEVIGDGFELLGPDLSGSILYARDQAKILEVKVLNPMEAASAILEIETDDPDSPLQSFRLEYDGTGIRLVDGTLQVVGTSGGDHVTISRVREHIQVAADFLQTPSRYPMDEVEQFQILLGDGQDHLNIKSTVGIDAVVSGGSGNDVLRTGSGNDLIEGGKGIDSLFGGAGADILLGGDGSDFLFGGFGDDLMIGGAGADFLSGLTGQDILIGGQTLFDQRHDGLSAIRSEWTNDEHDYASRTRNIAGEEGASQERLNGNFFLTTTGEFPTVIDDESVDVLFGGFGTDWYFKSQDDILLGKRRRERVN